MKVRCWCLFAAVFLWVGAFVPSLTFAQLTISVGLNRHEFLQAEPVMLEVDITNNSARPIKLEEKNGKQWLQIMVTKPSGEMVVATGALLPEPLAIENGQSVARRFNLTQLFQISVVGKYEVHAKLVSPGGTEFHAASRKFSVWDGVILWQETAGVLVPSKDAKVPAEKSTDKSNPYDFVRKHGAQQPDEPPANAEEQSRTYSLIQFTHNSANFLYLRVEDKSKNIVYGVFPLGDYLPFVKPQAQLDKKKDLHVLFQTGSRLFTYLRVDPSAHVTESFDLTNFNSSPKFTKTEDGRVIINGGERKNAD